MILVYQAYILPGTWYVFCLIRPSTVVSRLLCTCPGAYFQLLILESNHTFLRKSFVILVLLTTAILALADSLEQWIEVNDYQTVPDRIESRSQSPIKHESGYGVRNLQSQRPVLGAVWWGGEGWTQTVSPLFCCGSSLWIGFGVSVHRSLNIYIWYPR